MFKQKMQEILELIESEKFDEALTHLSQIIEDSNLSRSDLAKVYLVQGFTLQQQGQLDKAIEIWGKITQENDAEQYAKAQLNIGFVYQKQGKLDKAIGVWNQITQEDGAKHYAQAQFNIGNAYDDQGNTDKAIEIWGKITQENDAEQYAKAQLNMGFVYQKQGNLDRAIKAWSQITRKDDANHYAQAQFNLGSLYQNQGNLEKAIEVWNKITQEDDAETYAQIQLNLGVLYQEKGDLNEAIKIYQSILQKDNRYAYAMSQLVQGLVYLSQGKIDKAISVWEKIERNDIKYGLSYVVENIIKISTSSKIKNKKGLIKILLNIESIIEKLWVKDEKAIAHYTNLTVSKLLLSIKKSEIDEVKPESLFRLNTIRLMNDPEEGRLLNPLIGLANEKEAKNIAFISSFTLHHDSLNQFRLYGKENEREASGVSLVLNKGFFSDEHDTASVCSIKPSQKILPTIKSEKSNSYTRYPLYRCIYLDPNSGFFKIAHREEWSFYRQVVKVNISNIKQRAQLEGQKIEAKKQWEEYSNQLLKMEEEIKEKLEELIQHIKNIKEDFLHNDTTEQLLAEILLPLRYLVKHISFREEQECRILRIVDPKDEAIKYHSQIDRVYLDYQPRVLEYLEKIYLAPKAKDEKEIYEHLCIRGRDQLGIKEDENNSVKIKISRHPFR